MNQTEIYEQCYANHRRDKLEQATTRAGRTVGHGAVEAHTRGALLDERRSPSASRSRVAWPGRARWTDGTGHATSECLASNTQ